ncbi:MAG: hypothetical protein AAB381_02765 [Patescibacteria group bacterium]
MRKIIIIAIIFVSTLVCVNFVTQYTYIPFINESYGKLYLSIFKKDGKTIGGTFNNNNVSVVASKNTPYAILYLANESIAILNSSNDQLKILGEKSAKLSTYPFSPDGRKLIYSAVRPELGIPGSDNSNYTFYYYYDLYIYDISSGKSKIITDKNQNFLLNVYADSRYGWLDDNTVVYNCDLNKTYGPLKTCTYDIISGTTKASPVTTNLTGVTTNQPNIPTSFDFRLEDCFYDFEKQNCAYGVLRFRIWDAMLFQDIRLKMADKEMLLYRGKARADSLYWTSDNHLYGIFQGKLLKLY